MKQYKVKYLTTEIFEVPKIAYDMTPYWSYDLVPKTEIIEAKDAKSAVEKIKKRIKNKPKSGIFPNLVWEFELKDIELIN